MIKKQKIKKARTKRKRRGTMLAGNLILLLTSRRSRENTEKKLYQLQKQKIIKGPAESILEPLEAQSEEHTTTPAPTGKKALVKPKGGKALKRLELLAAQRKLPT